MPSTLENKVLIGYTNKTVKIDIYDTPLGKRFIEALKDNLTKQRILEKNFCFLGWADSKRNIRHLVNELNHSVEVINSFNFTPAYERIHPFSVDDFQYSSRHPIGKGIKKHTDNGVEWDISTTLGKRLKHEACNVLHNHFEKLQGTAWQLSDYYKQADLETKYAIRQLNNICHEIESWVGADRKKALEPEWMRPSQITTFLNAPRYDLHDEDYELFKLNRYRRELGGVYLHWSQIGKTLYEVFRDEGAPKMTEALCSEINHQKYYSGEFDIEWGQTIDEDTFDWKKKEMEGYRHWLELNGYDWDDPKLSLGYIKIGQVDLRLGFDNESFSQVYKEMKDNLNIKSIHTIGTRSWENYYPYTLDSEDWKQIQIESLRRGYESRSMR